MPNRAARRAAAHKTMEAARQAAAPVQSPVAEPVRPTVVSEAQLAANRANAQSSSGPKTEEGKLVSSHNALKTGLTGRTIVLPTDDVAAYQTLVALINKKFAPANDIEQHLTQTIADTEWRPLRIPTLESGLYALGRQELAADCAHEPDPQLRATMLEAHIFRTYQKDLRNLALQERRLRNQLRQDTAELRRLQQERIEQETATEPRASAGATAPVKPENGFEFSTSPAPSVPSPTVTTQPAEIHQEMEPAAQIIILASVFCLLASPLWHRLPHFLPVLRQIVHHRTARSVSSFKRR